MSVDEEAMLPGERLRRAREEQGLSQDEVSKHLRLSLSYLRALEEDDYDRLPEPPFIKGYLRNYARFLGLPAEERLKDARVWADLCHVLMNVKEFMKRIGCDDADDKKNVVYEVVEKGNGKWAVGLRVNMDDKDKMKGNLGKFGSINFMAFSSCHSHCSTFYNNCTLCIGYLFISQSCNIFKSPRPFRSSN